MKFGVREICNVVFRAKSNVTIGNATFKEKQPVLYIDSAKTSTLEGTATTVYAQGGRGNTRLIAWEGEKTLTFTVEDALLSPLGLSVLSGAGLIKAKTGDGQKVYVHATTTAIVDTEGKINLIEALNSTDSISATAPTFIVELEKDGSLTGVTLEGTKIETPINPEQPDGAKRITGFSIAKTSGGGEPHQDAGKTVMVDYYVEKVSANVSEIQIDAENFAGYYYVEADTLFRRQEDGVDLPANITIPNVKIQSNFTFSMASTGDPSTFTFTMDAMPGYTYFDTKKKVLCVIQVVEDAESSTVDWSSVMDDESTIAQG